MSKKKLFNDPVYGFITYPYEILYDIIEHPYFQRLRRISQQGMSHLVYPGAIHTRFHHALGALHLTCEALKTLKDKGVEITDQEAEGTCIAILLHDIGHGPYSHALEHTLVPFHHERMSLAIMRKINKEMDGKLDMGIQIFQNQHKKDFLYQLVSGQLDMDRLDYLNRDSFFTGVSEGVVSSDRIISMLDVRNNQLVVEEKGIYSVEKFLVARRFMYWQVYLHKTGIAAEQMLISFMKRLQHRYNHGQDVRMSEPLSKVLALKNDENDEINAEAIDLFCRIDDSDVLYTLKIQDTEQDYVLQYLSQSILNRKLFKVHLQNTPISLTIVEDAKSLLLNSHNITSIETEYLVIEGSETNQIYNKNKEKILILMKDGSILPLEEISDSGISTNSIAKYYICTPKS